MIQFEKFFESLGRQGGQAFGRRPHSWQCELGGQRAIQNRLIRIPTGLGKTLGVGAAWLFNRVVLGDQTWPNRLVWCLPMRTLVEQTASEIRSIAQPLDVKVHVLMGGSDQEDWDLYPERPAVIVGTQDILLSAALNRGYGTPRARWPLQFGQVNQDCLWVMDEVQLMDVGLATSAQLQAFRSSNSSQSVRPCYTWWMSATLQPDWLNTVDTRELMADLRERQLAVPEQHRVGRLWLATKPVTLTQAPSSREVVPLIIGAHENSPVCEFGKITLVVVNTVKLARELFDSLKKAKPKGSGTEIRLVHSRFRGHERDTWSQQFLARAKCSSEADRIIVATQVVEAGVDISSTTMITELAPWPNLVQRFGRAARYGGTANVIVFDRGCQDDKAAAPYAKDQLDSAREALQQIDDVGIASLERFEASCSEDFRRILYPYDPLHLLLHDELQELFDTTPDLTGADIDVGRFIRSGDEHDVRVFWREFGKQQRPESAVRPSRRELCAVAVGEAHKWLEKTAIPERRCWVWDYLDDEWRPCRKPDIYPGQTILVASSIGGYSQEAGWTGKPTDIPLLVDVPTAPHIDFLTDSAHENEGLSQSQWRTIANHGLDVANQVDQLGQALGLENFQKSILNLVARWHDIGKAHQAFVSCIRPEPLAEQGLTSAAKAPANAWKPLQDKTRYEVGPYDRRRGFRHELASAAGLFSVLSKFNPQHPALLGECTGVLQAMGLDIPAPSSEQQPAGIEQEILSLDRLGFDLAAYLVCAHHGKVRTTWFSTPLDQVSLTDDGMPLQGVLDGDRLPASDIATAQGQLAPVSELQLSLAPASIGLSAESGPSWTERVAGLVKHYGPFVLAWYEAIFRCADIRASRLTESNSLWGSTNKVEG